MAILDRIVVNAKFDIDAAAACFEELDFALTERGHHSTWRRELRRWSS
jgi:hypothetical protein